MSFKCFKLLNYRTSSVEGEGGRGGGGGGGGAGGRGVEVWISENRGYNGNAREHFKINS